MAELFGFLKMHKRKFFSKNFNLFRHSTDLIPFFQCFTFNTNVSKMLVFIKCLILSPLVVHIPFINSLF